MQRILTEINCASCVSKKFLMLSFAIIGTLFIAAMLFSNILQKATDKAQINQDKTAADLIFSEPYLKKIDHPAAVAYTYSHTTEKPQEFGATFDENVTIRVNPPTLEDGFNSVDIAMKSDGRERILGPFENTSGNPIVMMFLERDLNQMRSRVGGTPVYFRNTIRRAFRDSAEIEETSITLKGVEVLAQKVTIRPFVDEKNIGRFGKFRGKVFETIVSDAVPGGIYTMRSFVPSETPNTAPLVTNELNYQPGE